MNNLQAMGVPAGIVKDVKELLDDPHFTQGNMLINANHMKLGQIKTFNTPIRFFPNKIGVQVGENPPDANLGENTLDVLNGLLGLKKDEMDRLKDESVIWN